MAQNALRLWPIAIMPVAAMCALLGLAVCPKATVGYLCTVCGATKTQLEPCYRTVRFGHLNVHVTDSAVTRLRAELLGPCRHDWVLDWHNSLPWGFSSPSASMTHPVGRHTGKLATGLHRFGDRQAVEVALAAIGDRRNKLRFLAHDAVMSLATLDPAKLGEFGWEVWWRTHRRAFTVCYDRASALAIAWEYLGSGDLHGGAVYTFGYYGAWPPAWPGPAQGKVR